MGQNQTIKKSQCDFRKIVGPKDIPSLDVLDNPEDYFDRYEEIDPAQMEVLKSILNKGSESN
jgi:hypothetical protein